MQSIDLSALTVGTPVTSAKGAKTIPLSYGGKPIVWLPDAQIVVYEPSAFQDPEANRVNLVMHASPQATEALQAFDEHMVGFCAENSAKIFGKELTQDEVRLRHSPVLKQSDKGYHATFKAKITLSGRGAIKCWDSDRNLREAPESWKMGSVSPRIVFRCIWVMPKEWGVLLECSDALIDTAQPECPF